MEHYRSKHRATAISSADTHCIFLDVRAYQCWCYECDDMICPPLFIELEPETVTKATQAREGDAQTASSVATATSSGRRRTAGSRASSTFILPPGAVGLYNLGNSCYMNAAIQCLLNCPSIMGFFLHCAPFIYRHGHHRIAESFQKLVESIFLPNTPVVSPSRLVREVKMINPMFHGYTQQDTMDFVRCVFERLHEELGYTTNVHAHVICKETSSTEKLEDSDGSNLNNGNSPRRRSSRLATKTETETAAAIPSRQGGSLLSLKAKEIPRHRSLVSDTFGGILRSEIHCQECNCISVKDDPFYDVSIQICATPDGPKPPSKSSLAYIGNFFNTLGESIGLNGKPVKLETCLSAFCAPETLEGKDRYRCERCSRLVRSKKSLKFKELPQVLVLQMKRFRHESYFSSKIGTHVIFPTDCLDLTPYLHDAASESTRQETRYYLTGLISHRGTFGGGHYVAYCRHSTTGQWLELDDSIVSLVNEEDVAKVQAYILFYSLVDWNARKEREEWAPTIRDDPLVVEGEEAKEKEKEEKEKDKKESEFSTETKPNNLRTSPRLERRKRASQQPSPGVYVSKQWLNRWATMAHPGPIDNGELLCSHGALAPEKTVDPRDLVQFVPQSTYDFLVLRHGECSGREPAREHTPCRQCIEEERAIDERRKREERDIQALDTSTIKAGELWYLISADWLVAWGQFKTGTGPPPGPIGNDRLMVDETNPRPNLIRGTHYRGINRRVWEYFVRAYGGGPTIVRKTINIYAAAPDLGSNEAGATSEDLYVDVVGH